MNSPAIRPRPKDPLKRSSFKSMRTRTSGDRTVTFTASTSAVDRHGTIVDPKGIRTDNYEKNPVVLFGHDSSGSMAGPPSIKNVLGRGRNPRVVGNEFRIDCQFTPEGLNDTADTAFELVTAGFLGGISIGFIPKLWHEEQVDGRTTIIYDEVDLLEISVVPVPSNPEALVSRNWTSAHRALMHVDHDREREHLLEKRHQTERARKDFQREAAEIMGTTLLSAAQKRQQLRRLGNFYGIDA